MHTCTYECAVRMQNETIFPLYLFILQNDLPPNVDDFIFTGNQ